MNDSKTVIATGRRKEAVASVRLYPGKGKITVNDKPWDAYFVRERDRNRLTQPLAVASSSDKFDIIARVKGGGISGQADALCHSISRALIQVKPDSKPALRQAGFLSRDPRSKERKKYGQKGARKRFQWTKR